MNQIKNMITFSIGLIGIGMTLVVYAHSNFSTKGEVKDLKSDLKERDSDIVRRLDRMESNLTQKIDNLRR